MYLQIINNQPKVNLFQEKTQIPVTLIPNPSRISHIQP